MQTVGPATEFEKLITRCMKRVRLKYERRGKSEMWDEDTRDEFYRVFGMIPPALLESVTDEVLLNPPKDDRGRERNWLPDPADFVDVARRMADNAPQNSPGAVVAEIRDKMRRFGVWGVQEPGRPNVYRFGPPELSPEAAEVVEAMGGWDEKGLFARRDEIGVLDGMLMQHARDVVQRRDARPLFAVAKTQHIGAVVAGIVGAIGPAEKSLEKT